MDSSGVKVSREMQNGKKIVIRIKDITNFSASMFVLVIFYSPFLGWEKHIDIWFD